MGKTGVLLSTTLNPIIALLKPVLGLGSRLPCTQPYFKQGKAPFGPLCHETKSSTDFLVHQFQILHKQPEFPARGSNLGASEQSRKVCCWNKALTQSALGSDVASVMLKSPEPKVDG